MKCKMLLAGINNYVGYRCLSIARLCSVSDNDKKDPEGAVALGTDKYIFIIIGSKEFVNGKFEVL